MEEITKTENIESTPKEPKKKRGGFVKFIFILIVIAAAIAWLWYENILQKLQDEFLTEKKTVFINQENFIDSAESREIQVEPIKPNSSAPQLDVIPSLLPPILVENENAEASHVTAPAPISPETLQLKATTDSLVKNNRVIVLYIAMRDLKEALNEPDRFSHELAFVRAQSSEYPELAGRIQILEIIDAQGLPTINAVQEDLEKLHDKLRKRSSNSFMENVSNSLSRLVTVSKLEGEVTTGDFGSIIKRAEIALEQGNLHKAQIEIAKLGADGAIIAEKIKNIINARNIVDDLADNLKTKLIN